MSKRATASDVLAWEKESAAIANKIAEDFSSRLTDLALKVLTEEKTVCGIGYLL